MIVVAGGSLSGLRTAEQLRARGYADAITVVGDERHPPYNRPPLTKEILAPQADPAAALSQLIFRQRRSTADVRWLLGTRVVASDLAARHVRLDSGEVLQYSGLVVATGLRPRRLPFASPTVGRFVVRTIEDSLALQRCLQPGIRIVIVGAGFIGCEIAAAAIARGCDVTVVEGATGPMERSLGSELSDSMRLFLQARGVRFWSGSRVGGLLTTSDGSCGGVSLDDGTELSSDLVVESVGSASNVEWLDGNNLDLSDGVLCDKRMRVVGARHVVAVGDIARFPDSILGGPARRIEHWATPGDTAKIAAATLVAELSGAPVPDATTPLPSFWTDLFGLRICGVGTPAAATAVRVLEGDLAQPQQGLALGYLRNDGLVAVVTVGLPPARQIHYRNLVTSERELVTATPQMEEDDVA